MHHHSSHECGGIIVNVFVNVQLDPKLWFKVWRFYPKIFCDV